MAMHKTLTAFLVVASSLLAGAVAAQTAAVGGDGTVYELRAGFYGSFFPESVALAPTTPVLALVTTGADGTRSTSLAPTSEGLAIDSPRLLLLDAGSGVLTAVWESSEMPSSRLLRLAHVVPQGWTVPRLLVSSRLSEAPPRVVVSRQQLALGSEAAVIASRSIVHAVWQDGDGRVLYLPTVLVGGLDVGWHEVFSLTDLAAVRLATEAGPLTLTTPSTGLLGALAVDLVGDGDAVNVAFVEPTSGRVASLRLGVLPLELAFFSGDVHAAALELAPTFDPANPGGFAEKFRTSIIPIGMKYHLQTGVTDYVAGRIDAFIRTAGSGFADGEAMAEALRTFTLDVTAGLMTSTETGEVDGVIEIDLSAFLAGELGGQAAQVLDLRLAGSWPLPVTGEGDTSILPSADGRRAIVAWKSTDGMALGWVETAGSAWSEVRTLPIGSLGSAKAIALLADRVR